MTRSESLLRRSPQTFSAHTTGLCADARTTVRTLPSANHLFQRARSGAPSEYRTLKSEFVAGLSGELVRWLDQFITPAD